MQSGPSVPYKTDVGFQFDKEAAALLISHQAGFEWKSIEQWTHASVDERHQWFFFCFLWVVKGVDLFVFLVQRDALLFTIGHLVIDGYYCHKGLGFS